MKVVQYNLPAQRHNALSGIVSTVSCLLWLGFLGKLEAGSVEKV